MTSGFTKGPELRNEELRRPMSTLQTFLKRLHCGPWKWEGSP